MTRSPARRAYDALYLSPHLDDAVLSCGAHLARDARRGARVLVATVFSRGDASARRLYARRRAEDRAALAALGADARHLALPDAPYRAPYYAAGFAPIVLGLHADDRAAWPARLRARLAALVRATGARAVYAPLGVGTHVDHRLVHDAARAAVPATVALAFYEDRPYALVPGAVDARLAELGASVTSPDNTALRPVALGRGAVEHHLAQLCAAPYVARYLPPGPARTRALARLRARLLATAHAPARARVVLRAAPPLVATRAERARVETAVRCYASQLADLFAGDADRRARATEHARALTGARVRSGHALAERCWHLVRDAAVPDARAESR